MPKKKSNVNYLGTGRRKSSVARVYMTPGTGKITVGEKTLEEYLPQEIHLYQRSRWRYDRPGRCYETWYRPCITGSR